MKKLIPLFLILIFLLPITAGDSFTIHVESPKVTSQYQDYDIRVLSCNFSSNVTILLQVWGDINVHPAKGYIKEYDVNITDVSGDYVHIFLMSDNGSEPISFVSISGKTVLIDYHIINNSTLRWILPSSYLKNISGDPRISAYAGIVDISQNKFLFLDHVMYPEPPKQEELFPLWLYIPIAGAVGAIIIYVYLRSRK